MHEEIAKLRAGQEQMNNRLDDVAWAGVSVYPQGKKFKCSFHETDEHGFKECEVKELFIYCGIDNHREVKCIWPSNTSTFCKVQGHANIVYLLYNQNKI